MKDEECHDCRYKASNFQELKSHYSQQHHQSWTHDTEEILTTKPKSHLEGMQIRNDMNNKSLMRLEYCHGNNNKISFIFYHL